MGTRKLAVAAGAFSAAIFAANYILPLRFLIYAAVLSAVLGALLILPQRKWLRPGVIALMSFALGILAYQLNYDRTVGRTLQYNGESYPVYAELTDYPTVYEDYCRLEVKLLGDELPGLKAIVYDNEMSCTQLLPGQRISFTGTIRRADTVYGESYDNYYSKGIYLKISAQSGIEVLEERGGNYSILVISRSLSGHINKIFPEDTSAFMQALLLGDKSLLYEDEGLHLAMTRAGFMHIVAVSGLHVAFLVGLLRLILGSGRRSALLCLALIWLFVFITGASPSAVRAGFMQSFLLLAPLLRRENDPPTSLSLALALILLQNPFAAASISLQLSFAAVAGIFCFSGRIYSFLISVLPKLAEGRLGRYAAANTATSLGVMVFTTPLTAVHFGYIPVLAILSNIAGLWAVSLCFGLGWAACALSLLPWAGFITAWLCSWFARYIFLVSRLVSALPVAVLYLENTMLVSWMLGCYALFIVFAHFRKSIWLRIGLPGAVGLLSLITILCYVNFDYNKGRDTLAVIDLGQGLCTAALGDNCTVVVDCGGEYSLEDAGELAGKYLISRGRHQVDLLVITELTEGHANGAAMLMEMVEVERLILPRTRAGNGLLEELLAAALEKGIEVEYIDADTVMGLGDVELELIAGYTGNRGNRLSVLLDLGGYRALVTGETREGERRLESVCRRKNIQLLVAGSHGCDDSCSRSFLRSLGAEDAVLSVGFNYQDCPAEETLERLELCGYNVYRTDLDGTVEIRISE